MFASILVGTDGSDTATTAVRHAIDLAVSLGARLQIVSAYEPVSGERLRSEAIEAPQDVEWMVNPREDVLQVLKDAERDAESAGLSSVETFARQGDAADAILDVAEEQRSDLIVVGNRGMTGARRMMLGSVPTQVMHRAPTDVLIAKTVDRTLDDLGPGMGGLVNVDGKKIAAYRNPDGSIVALSPRCAHMGCTVDWNSVESTWDCPCHGSRYTKEGELLQGPAKTGLDHEDVPS